MKRGKNYLESLKVFDKNTQYDAAAAIENCLQTAKEMCIRDSRKAEALGYTFSQLHDWLPSLLDTCIMQVQQEK